MKYNGHRNYAYWNVALWINNDSGLYERAKSFRDQGLTRTQAATAMMHMFFKQNITKTPDGVLYTKHNVMMGLAGIWEE